MARLAPPVPGGKICGRYPFAWRNGAQTDHRAIDWCAPKGTPIISVLPGVVVEISNTPHGGNNLIIKHDNGLHTYYAHCDKILVRVGQRIRAMQQIATVGATGSPNPGVVFIDPHLHMQVQAGQSFSTQHYNPLDLLAKLGIVEENGVMVWKAGFPKKPSRAKKIIALVATLGLVGIGYLSFRDA